MQAKSKLFAFFECPKIHIGHGKNYIRRRKNYIRHNSNYIGHNFCRCKYLKNKNLQRHRGFSPNYCKSICCTTFSACMSHHKRLRNYHRVNFGYNVCLQNYIMRHYLRAKHNKTTNCAIVGTYGTRPARRCMVCNRIITGKHHRYFAKPLQFGRMRYAPTEAQNFINREFCYYNGAPYTPNYYAVMQRDISDLLALETYQSPPKVWH